MSSACRNNNTMEVRKCEQEPKTPWTAFLTRKSIYWYAFGNCGWCMKRQSEHSKYLRNQQKQAIKGLCSRFASYENEKRSSVTRPYAKCPFPGSVRDWIGRQQIARIWSNNFSLKTRSRSRGCKISNCFSKNHLAMFLIFLIKLRYQLCDYEPFINSYSIY